MSDFLDEIVICVIILQKLLYSSFLWWLFGVLHRLVLFLSVWRKSLSVNIQINSFHLYFPAKLLNIILCTRVAVSMSNSVDKILGFFFQMKVIKK